jgi:integrase
MAYSIHKKTTRKGVRYVLDYRDAHNLRRRPEYETRAEADDAAKMLVPTSAQRRGAVGCDAKLTVRDWATSWLAKIRPGLKARAYEVHARAMRLYLLPRLGDVRLVELRRGVILDALLDCQARGGIDPKTQEARPLKPGSVRTIYSAIRACLQAAVEREMLPANPASKLGGKRGGLRCEPTKHERRARIEQRVLDTDEVARLEFYTKAYAARWLPLLLVYTRAGLRLGETLALEADDFSPAGGGSLRIRQALDYRTGKLGPPKHGPRVVDLTLSPQLVAVLKAQVAGLRQRAVETARIGPRWLFPAGTGGTFQPRNVNRKIGELGAAAGLPRPVSPHDLRHTYATLLIEAGCSPAYVQQQLGHSSIQLTIDTYAATAKPRLPAALVGLFDRPATALVSKEVAGHSAKPPEKLDTIGHQNG